jgi:altronate dehydratase small subunit
MQKRMANTGAILSMSEVTTRNAAWGLCLNPRDNVATLLETARAGCWLTVKNKEGHRLEDVQACEEIQRGHKIAIESIPQGAHVIKYGEIIGRATQSIAKGQRVHVHNLESLRGRGDLHD